MFQNDKINSMVILYCLSGNYIDVFLTSFRSLLINNATTSFNIYIFHNYQLRDLNELQFKLRKFEKYNINVELIFVDNIFDLDHLPLHGHIDISTYYRLLIGKYIPRDVKKIIYLDADVIINGSIDELYFLDLKGKAIGAVNHNISENNTPIKLISRFKDLNLDKKLYFNAGVLLIDYQLWLSADVLKKAQILLKKYSTQLEWWDQDILNIIFVDSIIFISPKWNYIHYCMNDIELLESPVIYHFAGPSKPWYIFLDVPYKSVFWKYYSQKLFFKHLDRHRLFRNIKLSVLYLKQTIEIKQ